MLSLSDVIKLEDPPTSCINHVKLSVRSAFDHSIIPASFSHIRSSVSITSLLFFAHSGSTPPYTTRHFCILIFPFVSPLSPPVFNAPTMWVRACRNGNLHTRFGLSFARSGALSGSILVAEDREGESLGWSHFRKKKNNEQGSACCAERIRIYQNTTATQA